MNTKNWPAEAHRIAAGIRQRAFDIAVAQHGGYLGQACSAAEILATLYAGIMREDEGDVLVLSPAHYCLALYAALVETGDLSPEELDTYNQDGSPVEMVGGTGAPGMLFTTGSLAQGLSQAIGYALARRLRGTAGGRIFVFMSDGELEEGQTWEAFMSLAHHRINEITVLLDANDNQVDGAPSGIMNPEPIRDKLLAFGLDAHEVNGHDCQAIYRAVGTETGETARAVICRTNIWQGIPSLRERHNLHFVRFREGEAAIAQQELQQHAPVTP